MIGSIVSRYGGTSPLSFKLDQIKDIEVVKHPLFESCRVVLSVDKLGVLIENMFSLGHIMLASGMKKEEADNLKQALLNIKNGNIPETTHTGQETIERRLINGAKFADKLFGTILPIFLKIGLFVIVLLSLLLFSYFLARGN